MNLFLSFSEIIVKFENWNYFVIECFWPIIREDEIIYFDHVYKHL